ncbi:hypothetical protein PYV61_23575, partial [Roseisolibacter sp. H3M3-2]
MTVRRAARLALVAVLPAATGACFATRTDVRVLQQDIASARAEAARADSARARQPDAAAAQLRAAQDSLRSLSQRAAGFQGDAKDDLRAIREQLIQVQELTGQSQRRIQELRASLAGRAPGVAPGGGGTPGATPGAAAGDTS